VYGALIATAATVGLVALALIPGRAQVAGYVGAPLWALATWRAWHLGLQVEGAGVKVSGFIFSRRVPWSDIDHGTIMPSGSYPYVAHLVRKHGRAPIVITGISGPRGKTEPHRLEVQRPVDELNALLAQSQARNR